MAGAEKKVGSRAAGLRFLTLLAALAPAPANAGAWIAPEGGQQIWTNALGEVDGAEFFETSVYWEVPVGENNAFVVAPWLQTRDDIVQPWQAEATLGFKRAFYREGDNVMALQAGAVWLSHPSVECGEGGSELRWLGGRSLSDTGAFANVEVASRAFDGGCGSERVDLTAGYQPAEGWLVMGQVFFDAPHEGDEVTKAQLTVVRFGSEGAGLQIGLRARVDGGDAEPALVIGLWGLPGD